MTVLFAIRAADFWEYQTDGDYVRTHVSGRYSPSKMVSDIPVFIPASFLFSLRLCRGSDGIVPNDISGTQLALSILVSDLLDLAWCL
ncbi:hypothetical protein WISP_96021 [Willisornis vidua]|uniref:Uncharacterized protein n=1 Tax=Willisornis vidua TaxID=1566151 RepID=A0ABQ9D4E4_9PASS|nr:hypothetical protein WISP_96021 [Willisornis vidua]